MPRLPKTVAVPVAALAVLSIGGVVAFGLPWGRADHLGAHRIAPPPSPSTTQPPGSWIRQENAKPGTTAWRLSTPSRNGTIEGYAGAVSIDHGQPVALYISTSVQTYRVQAYRMGYYGGAGGRLVWSSPTEPGHLQRPPTVAPRTNLVEAAWTPSVRVTTDATWPPGDYLFKLIADNGQQSYIPLTVRDDSSRGGLFIQNSVTTWQAYNLWGGFDLYEGRTPRGSSFANRSRIVSFDRPYKIGDGSGDFLGEEFNLVSLVESLGLDVSYTTDLDVHEHPDLLLQHRAYISLGHDEYWSTAMRDGVDAARDRGVNLAFLGANAVFRHIRLTASPLGPDRREIDYKSAAEDPLNGINNAEVTPNSWREPPNNRPENTLLGELYQCNPVRADLVVSEPTSWIFDGTNLTAGQRLADVVGSEYDGYDPRLKGPTNVEILAHSPVRCRGTPGYSDFTYYTARSGAGVIDTGTNQWIPRLIDPAVAPELRRVTENILVAFAGGPVAGTHPSQPNFSSLASGAASSPTTQASPPTTGP